jgi:putative FmdB family regulatory protein
VPKYAYRCKECDHAFEAVHGMLMKLRNCDACSADGSLFRVPSITYSMKSKVSSENKTGEIVKEFISEARKEVEEEKRDMREDYNK